MPACRHEFDLGVKIRARLLTTVPDSTSLKFVLLGTLTRKSKDKGPKGQRHVVVHIDFESLKKRKCGEGDMEKWYARTIGGQPDCLMGHKVRWSFPPGRREMLVTGADLCFLVALRSNGSCGGSRTRTA